MKEMVGPSENEYGNIVITDSLKTPTLFNNHFATQFTQKNLDSIPDPINVSRKYRRGIEQYHF